MKRVFSAPNGIAVHNVKNVLEARGIACEIRGQDRVAGTGELPPIECWVELWVENDRDADEAERIIRQESRVERSPWTCPECGEGVEASFDQCWNCQADRPS